MNKNSLQSTSLLNGQELNHFYVGTVLPAQKVALIKQENCDISGSHLFDISGSSSVSSSHRSEDDSGRNSPKQRQRWSSQEDYRLGDMVRKHGNDDVREF